MGEEVIPKDKMTKIPSPSSQITIIKTTTTRPRHFVFVHGAGHGAWCWYKVQTDLESLGHTVTCLDLKASGVDPTPINTILNFHDYNQPLVDFLSSLPPQQKGTPDLPEYGNAIELRYGKGVDQPPTSAYVKPQFQRNIFYQLCSIEDTTLASMLFRPFPLIWEGKWEENDEAKGVRRVYIKTSQDRAIKPEKQDVMIKKWPPSQVYTIHTDHSPFFSASSLLSSLLAKIALSP